MSGRPVSGSSYERLLLIGRGGMGEVFLARQRGVEGFRRPVAVKRILPGHGNDPELRRMFLSEAQMTAGLSHPNICQTIDLCSSDAELFLVLELLEGVTLSALMRQIRGLPSAMVGALLVQACAGLDHAHSKGLIHRDLSPSNLFLTTDGVLKILDFGVAKVMGTELSSSGPKGKSPYMSPEQVAGRTLDERSDLFALGAIGLEALSGMPLFLRDSDYLTYQAILDGTRPVGLTSSPLDPVLAPCLEVDPAARPRSARALAHAIRGALSAHGGEASAHELSAYLEQHMSETLASLRARTAEALAEGPEQARVVLHTVEFALEPPAPASTGPSAGPPGQPERAGAERPGAAPPAGAPRLASPAGIAAWLLVALALLLAVLWLAVPRLGDPAGALSRDAAQDPAPPVRPAAKAAVADAVPERAAHPAKSPGEDTAPMSPRRGVAGKVAVPASGDRVDPPERARPRRFKKPGYVSLDATPFANIHIDGKPVGTTPVLRHPLPEGVHRVVATTQDGRSKRFRIRVREGKLTVRRMRFD